MTAFLFSEVRICGLETTFTRLSAARAVSMAKNSLAEKARAVSPPAGRTSGMPGRGKMFSGGPRPGVPGEMLCDAMVNLPVRIAQSTPSLVSSVSRTSVTRTSMRTWRGMRSSCLMVSWISSHARA